MRNDTVNGARGSLTHPDIKTMAEVNVDVLRPLSRPGKGWWMLLGLCVLGVLLSVTEFDQSSVRTFGRVFRTLWVANPHNPRLASVMRSVRRRAGSGGEFEGGRGGAIALDPVDAGLPRGLVFVGRHLVWCFPAGSRSQLLSHCYQLLFNAQSKFQLAGYGCNFGQAPMRALRGMARKYLAIVAGVKESVTGK